MTTPLHVKYRPLWVGALALAVLPFILSLIGLTVNTASVLVILAIAALGLNVLAGFTGLVSFGHAAWFGIGAYAAALAQRPWLPVPLLLPLLLAMALVATISTIYAILLRRRTGVYFALLPLP